MNAVLSVEMANSKPTINYTEVILVKGLECPPWIEPG
jgi:hypothetical protein